MKSILTILTVFILLVSNFTFSSCKNCNGNKDKNNSKDNSVTDTGQSKDNSDDPYNSATDRYKNNSNNVSILDDPDLAKIKEHLQARGASPTEIEATMYIATEDFGKGIGRVIFDRDSRGVDHDGRQTTNSCGLYAVKRHLFVLGKHPDTGIGGDLWYQHTDAELRNYPTIDGSYGSGETIDASYIKTLMRELKVPGDYLEIYHRNIDGFRCVGFCHLRVSPDVLNAGRAKAEDLNARLLVEVNKVREIKQKTETSQDKKVLQDALTQIEVVEQVVMNIEKEAGALGERAFRLYGDNYNRALSPVGFRRVGLDAHMVMWWDISNIKTNIKTALST
jgi:hypothetical protein